jgi:hypothetical protein
MAASPTTCRASNEEATDSEHHLAETNDNVSNQGHALLKDDPVPAVTTNPREQFLDRFPFSDDELDQVLAAYRRCHEQQGNASTPQLLLSDMVQSSTLDTPDFFTYVAVVEETIVSKRISQQLVHVALDSVVVCFGNNDDDGEDSAAIQTWLEAVATLLGRRGPRTLLSVFFRAAVQLDQTDEAVVIDESHQKDITATANTLVDMMHRWIVATCYLQEYHQNQQQQEQWAETNHKTLLYHPPPQSWIASLTSRSQSDGRISLSSWMDFATWTAPQVAAALSSYCHLCWWGPDHAFRGATSLPFELPQSHNPEEISAIWKNRNEMAMSLGLIGLGGDWRRLYSTDLDANHFNILQQALQGYQGKTILLIQTTGGAVFGYYTECAWKVSQTWYGAQSDAFLFRLGPVLDLYGRNDENDKASPYAMYLNPTPVATRNRKAEEALSGLAVGGISDQIPRLHLNKSLENCKAFLTDRTYRSGPLLENDDAIFFDIDVLELWAVKTPDEQAFAAGCESGKKQIAVQEAFRVKVAKVTDRSVFLSDFESDDCHMRAKIYAHRDEVRGRHEFVARAEGQGYFIEDHPPSVRRVAEGQEFFVEDGPPADHDNNHKM